MKLVTISKSIGSLKQRQKLVAIGEQCKYFINAKETMKTLQ